MDLDKAKVPKFAQGHFRKCLESSCMYAILSQLERIRAFEMPNDLDELERVRALRHAM